MRGDFAIGDLDRQKQPSNRQDELNDRGCLSFMLGLLALAEPRCRSRASRDPRRRSRRRCPPQPRHVGADLPAVPARSSLAAATERSRPSPGRGRRMRPPRPDPPQGVVHAERRITAKLRVDRGELATGLRLWRDVLRRLHWSGELGLTLDATSQLWPIRSPDIDPTLALELLPSPRAAPSRLSQSSTRSQAYERLAHTLDELGPDALQAARYTCRIHVLRRGSRVRVRQASTASSQRRNRTSTTHPPTHRLQIENGHPPSGAGPRKRKASTFGPLLSVARQNCRVGSRRRGCKARVLRTDLRVRRPYSSLQHVESARIRRDVPDTNPHEH